MASINPCFGFVASGELFGYETEALIAKMDSGLLTAGRLSLNGDGVGGIAAKAISGLPPSFSGGAVFPKVSSDLRFILQNNEFSAMYSGNGLIFAMQTGERWNVIAAINTSALKKGNAFEKFVYDAASWAGISKVTIMLKSAVANPNYEILEKLTDIKTPTLVTPDSYKKYQLVAGADMNLNSSTLGKGIKALTGLSSISFLVGGNFSDSSFAASLMLDDVTSDICEIRNLGMKLALKASDFGLSASGELVLKLDTPVTFLVSGDLTMTSFLLTAASVKGTKLYITKNLFLSDIALTIGYDKGLSLGMCGRATSSNISMFAGINLICSPTPRLSLLTAAVSSVKGSLSIKDIIEEFVEIKSNEVNFLDMILIKDFDLQGVKLAKPLTDSTTEAETEELFNAKIASEMKMSKGDAQLTPLGSKQYILTDKGRMRHYRIDATGIVSLNCQIFICTESLKLGQYDIKPGFFFCGELEIFNIRVRFLFDINKGESLVALVSLSPVKIGKLLTITKSSLNAPIQPISGGLAGQLVKSDSGGALLYININRSTLNFYLTARIQLLSFFTLDAIIIIRQKIVYIDVERTLFGFKTILKLAVAYESFNNARFAIAFIFDATEFLAAVKAASDWLLKEAKNVENATKEAQRKITEAQNKVNSLQSQIWDFDNKIAACKREISNAKWYKKAFVAIAQGVKIAAFEVAKAGVYVAMKAAVLVLEAAKAVVGVGGAIAANVLKGVAKILTAATQLFFIKRLELSMDASASTLQFGASLDLTVMGSDKQIKGTISVNTSDIGGIIFGFVKDRLMALAKEVISPFKSDDYYLETEMEYYIPAEYDNLGDAMAMFEKGRNMMENATELFIEVERAHCEIYGQQNDMTPSYASDIAIIVSEYEANYEQFSQGFDKEFIDSLNTVCEAMPVDRAGELSHTVSSLENFAKANMETHRSSNDFKSSRLMKDLEKEVDVIKNRTHRSGEGNTLSPLEANKAMADAIDAALNKHFGDAEENSFINPAKEDIILDAVSLLRFSGKRRKQKRPPNPDYIQRL